MLSLVGFRLFVLNYAAIVTSCFCCCFQISVFMTMCVFCFIISYHYFIKKAWTTEGWSGSMLLCDYFSCILRKGVANLYLYILVLFCLFRRATPADDTARCLPAAK